MADEEVAGAPDADKGKSPVIKLVILGVMILMAAGVGFATWSLVLKDLVQPPDLEEVEVATTSDFEIPMYPVYFEMPDAFVQLQREGVDYAASLFTYKVSLECNNQATADFIDMRLPRFQGMIQELHLNLTRAEMDLGLSLQKSIQRQALQKCNDMLRQMQGDAIDEEIRITAVLHTQWAVSDQ